jgi:hypothetical protein
MRRKCVSKFRAAPVFQHREPFLPRNLWISGLVMTDHDCQLCSAKESLMAEPRECSPMLLPHWKVPIGTEAWSPRSSSDS